MYMLQFLQEKCHMTKLHCIGLAKVIAVKLLQKWQQSAKQLHVSQFFHFFLVPRRYSPSDPLQAGATYAAILSVCPFIRHAQTFRESMNNCCFSTELRLDALSNHLKQRTL